MDIATLLSDVMVLLTYDFSFTFLGVTFTLDIFTMFMVLLFGTLIVNFINYLIWE